MDPLNLKPQLSALADSVTFGFWCESSYKDKIVLGGQDVPHGDQQHAQVFGALHDISFDGIHMRGPAALAFLTRSVQKVLIKAELVNSDALLYRPEGLKQQESLPNGGKSTQNYDAMGIMINRIRAVSTSQPMNSNPSNQPSGRVSNPDLPNVQPTVIQPNGRKYNIHTTEPSRCSVIKPGSQADMQANYNVPVSNTFSNLN